VQRGIANVEQVGADRQVRTMLFQNSERKQARALGTIDRSDEIRAGELFPMDGTFLEPAAKVEGKPTR